MVSKVTVIIVSVILLTATEIAIVATRYRHRDMVAAITISMFFRHLHITEVPSSWGWATKIASILPCQLLLDSLEGRIREQEFEFPQIGKSL